MDAAGGALRACAAVPVGVRVGAYTGKFIFAASCCRDTVSYRTRKIRSGPAGGTASHGSSGSTGQPQADLNLTRPWLGLGAGITGTVISGNLNSRKPEFLSNIFPNSALQVRLAG